MRRRARDVHSRHGWRRRDRGSRRRRFRDRTVARARCGPGLVLVLVRPTARSGRPSARGCSRRSPATRPPGARVGRPGPAQVLGATDRTTVEEVLVRRNRLSRPGGGAPRTARLGVRRWGDARPAARNVTTWQTSTCPRRSPGAGAALCVLGGYLVGVVAGPDTTSRTTAQVASYDASSHELCLDRGRRRRSCPETEDGTLCGTWRRPSATPAAQEGDEFRFVVMSSHGHGEVTTFIYGDVVELTVSTSASRRFASCPTRRPKPHLGTIRFPEPARSPWWALGRRLLLAIGILGVHGRCWSTSTGTATATTPTRRTRSTSATPIYYTTVTLSTTGYGDIAPVHAGRPPVNAFAITPLRIAFLVLLIGTTLEVLATRGGRCSGWPDGGSTWTSTSWSSATAPRAAAPIDTLVNNGHSRDAIVVVDPDVGGARRGTRRRPHRRHRRRHPARGAAPGGRRQGEPGHHHHRPRRLDGAVGAQRPAAQRRRLHRRGRPRGRQRLPGAPERRRRRRHLLRRRRSAARALGGQPGARLGHRGPAHLRQRPRGGRARPPGARGRQAAAAAAGPGHRGRARRPGPPVLRPGGHAAGAGRQADRRPARPRSCRGRPARAPTAKPPPTRSDPRDVRPEEEYGGGPAVDRLLAEARSGSTGSRPTGWTRDRGRGAWSSTSGRSSSAGATASSPAPWWSTATCSSGGSTRPARTGSRADDPDRRVVLVCNEGYSSSLAAATLRRLGLAPGHRPGRRLPGAAPRAGRRGRRQTPRSRERETRARGSLFGGGRCGRDATGLPQGTVTSSGCPPRDLLSPRSRPECQHHAGVSLETGCRRSLTRRRWSWAQPWTTTYPSSTVTGRSAARRAAAPAATARSPGRTPSRATGTGSRGRAWP